MKAICVTPSRQLEVRDVPAPDQPATDHVLIDMDSSAINHGDKTFLKMPLAAGGAFSTGRYDVWGASGAGRVAAIGPGVPSHYLGKQVGIYRSLGRTADGLGLWSETSHVPYTTCVILPDGAQMRNFSGSLVNVITAYAFLDEIAAQGHAGVIVTAGNSATGHALAALARRRHMPAIFLARSERAHADLMGAGAEHVIVTGEGYAERLGPLAAELKATAVFDGIGGNLISGISPALPMNSTIYCYGFLGGNTPISIPAALIMMKNITVRRFSNFESGTVKDRARLVAALTSLEGVIDDPLFYTKLGESFTFEQIDRAMAYESSEGRKAVLVA